MIFKKTQIYLNRVFSLVNVNQYHLFNFVKSQGLENQLQFLSQKQNKAANSKNKQGVTNNQNSNSSGYEKRENLNDMEFDPEENKVHFPVLVDKISNIIKQQFFPLPSSISTKCLLDSTLGTGGHSKHFLKHFSDLFIVGLDMDDRMIKYVEQNVLPSLDSHQSQRLKIIRSNFINIDKLNLSQIYEDQFSAFRNFHAIFADLGYNSIHLNEYQFGFSYLKNSPLDMRYDTTQPHTAADIVFSFFYDESALKQLIAQQRQFGEEPNADIVSNLIIERRQKEDFKMTKDVVDLILDNKEQYSFKGGEYKTITRVFQSLRIATNQELNNLEQFMDKIFSKLLKDGIGIVITFHSLEEKIVEQALKKQVNSILDFIKNYFSFKKKLKKIEVICMGERASETEIQINPKSRSAKLYAFKMLVK